MFYALNFSVSPEFDGGTYLLSIANLPSLPPKDNNNHGLVNRRMPRIESGLPYWESGVVATVPSGTQLLYFGTIKTIYFKFITIVIYHMDSFIFGPHFRCTYAPTQLVRGLDELNNLLSFPWLETYFLGMFADNRLRYRNRSRIKTSIGHIGNIVYYNLSKWRRHAPRQHRGLSELSLSAAEL